MVFWILAAAATLLVVVTLLPLLRYEAWWIRGQDFPRLQYAIAACVLLAVAVCTLDVTTPAALAIVGSALLCLGYHLWWIWPYTKLKRVEVQTVAGASHRGDTLRIVGANVLMTNRNADALLRIVREARADVLIAVETDAWWEGQLDALLDEMPHALKCPLGNLYGMHLYSRLPLIDPAIQFLVEPDIPSMHALLELPSGRRVKLHCVHPRPPSPTENPVSTERDAELIAVAKSVAADPDDGPPVIVAGDLNDVAWSATTRLFRKTSGLLDPRVGRGMYNTFHTGYWFLRWPLDHLFHSDHFGLVELRRLPAFGSDHFPILIELAAVDGLEHHQHGLTPDPGDRKLAAEKTAAEGVSGAEVHTPGGR